MSQEQNEKQPEVALTLPYAELTDLALSRDARRKVFKDIDATLARETRYIDISAIHIRDGFNWRIKPENMAMEQWLSELEIPELAMNILATNGVTSPLEGDLTSDGKFFLTEGYRRNLAILYLIEEGHEHYDNGMSVKQVEVMVNDKETTELDRMVRIFTSQYNKKLKPMELAMGLLRIKKTYSMTHEQIAANIGMSRQWVDNKIALAEEPEPIRTAIDNGQLSETAAIKLKKSVTTETARVHKVQESIDNNIPLTVATADNLKKEKMEAAAGELFDCTNEKNEAEMNLSEAINMTDKITMLIKNMPAQYRDDVENWLGKMRTKMESAREYVKKSSDRR